MKFLTDNSTEARLLRTIFQGLIGVIIANLDIILGAAPIDPAYKPIIAAACMAVLSPIMSELGKRGGQE